MALPEILPMEKLHPLQKQVSVSAKTLLISALVIILIIAGLLIWKAVGMKRVEKQLQAETKALNKKWLMRMAQPYVWAIRKEIMNGNIAAVNLYGNELVREGPFSDVLVATPDGKIISATNKRFEGAEFSSYAKPEYLKADTATVHEVDDSRLLMVSPVMGLNERIATVVINYPEKIKNP